MQGSIAFDGTLSGSIAGGGGGGSEVTITPTLSSGTKIADYEIDGTPGELYAPNPEALPGTIVTKVLREYNDTTQTKIAKVTTLDTSNNQEVSQDLYAPSPVQCWYTPGLEQDYEIGKFTYGGVTQNVYIPYFQRPLTAGANITIDADNVISASGGSSWDYSTSEVNTGQKWINGHDIYCKVIMLNNRISVSSNYSTIVGNIPDIEYLIDAICYDNNGGTDYQLIRSITNANMEVLVSNGDIIVNYSGTSQYVEFTGICVKYTKTA